MQDLLEHNALPEGSFSARIAINISNKPKLLLLEAEERIAPTVCLIKAWFLLFLHTTFSKARACMYRWETTKEQLKAKWEGTETAFKAKDVQQQHKGILKK